MNTDFFISSILVGLAMAMDAFSVSVADGLNDPNMKHSKHYVIAGCFGIFQGAMPLIGWAAIRLFLAAFSEFQKYIPWIGFVLLVYIGGKMIIEGLRGESVETDGTKLGFGELLVQGVATSIDALSLGFALEEYELLMASVESAIICVVTFICSLIGIRFGKILGARFLSHASIAGGCILIGIAINIVIR